MNTGTVKFFKTNDFGGFGFLVLEDGSEIYFQKSHGGPVVAGEEQPKIQAGALVRMPHSGDQVIFEVGSNGKGDIASPWCFQEDWNATLIDLHKRPTYRLVRQKGHRFRGLNKPQVMWEGSFPQTQSHVRLGVQYNGDDFTKRWFEQLIEDRWVKCESPVGQLIPARMA